VPRDERPLAADPLEDPVPLGWRLNASSGGVGVGVLEAAGALDDEVPDEVDPLGWRRTASGAVGAGVLSTRGGRDGASTRDGASDSLADAAGALGAALDVLEELLDEELSDESEVELDDGAEPLGWRLRASPASAGAAARSRVRPSAKCRVFMASS
jgi:hypothetical protein